MQGNDFEKRTVAIASNGQKKLQLQNSSLREKSTTPRLSLTRSVTCNSFGGLATRQGKAHFPIIKPILSEGAYFEGSQRPCDAREQKSLKKQMQQMMCQTSGNSSGYSRGPEIFKALEKLRSKSHS